MLGQLLKKARVSQGLTMAGLAQKAGLSASYISQVEKNRVKPSLAALGRLAEALNIKMDKLMYSQQAKEAIVVRKSDRSLIKFTDLPMPGELLSPILRHGMFFNYDVVEMRIPPFTNCGNQETPMPIYYEMDDCVYVCSGEVVCTYDDGQKTLRTGDAAYIPRGVSSHIGNQSDEEAVILLITKLEN